MRSELVPLRDDPVWFSSVLISLMASLMSPLLMELLSSKLQQQQRHMVSDVITRLSVWSHDHIHRHMIIIVPVEGEVK